MALKAWENQKALKGYRSWAEAQTGRTPSSEKNVVRSAARRTMIIQSNKI